MSACAFPQSDHSPLGTQEGSKLSMCLAKDFNTLCRRVNCFEAVQCVQNFESTSVRRRGSESTLKRRYLNDKPTGDFVMF